MSDSGKAKPSSVTESTDEAAESNRHSAGDIVDASSRGHGSCVLKPEDLRIQESENEFAKNIFSNDDAIPFIDEDTDIKSPSSSFGYKLPAEFVYKTDHRCRGKAVIIDEQVFNSKDLEFRAGSYHDRKKIEKVLQQLGFKRDNYHVLVNATCDEIVQELKSVAKEDHTQNDMFMCVIMSHGESGLFHATDIPVKVSLLLDLFREENCPSLANKPKVFFIQSCRGEAEGARLDPGVEVKCPDTKRRQQDDSYDGSDDETDAKGEMPVILSSSPTSSLLAPPTSVIQGTTGNKRTRCSSESALSELPASQCLPTNKIRDEADESIKRHEYLGEFLQVPQTENKRHSSFEGIGAAKLQHLKELLMAPNPQVQLRRGSYDRDDSSINVCLESAHHIPDMLVAYSTVDGHYSFRNESEGSWFIQTVCDKLEKLYETEDLMSIMTHTSSFIAMEKMSRVTSEEKLRYNQKKQIPCVASTLRKLLYFVKQQQ